MVSPLVMAQGQCTKRTSFSCMSLQNRLICWSPVARFERFWKDPIPLSAYANSIVSVRAESQGRNLMYRSRVALGRDLISGTPNAGWSQDGGCPLQLSFNSNENVCNGTFRSGVQVRTNLSGRTLINSRELHANLRLGTKFTKLVISKE